MTTVFVPEKPSRFVASDAPTAPTGTPAAQRPRPAAGPEPGDAAPARVRRSSSFTAVAAPEPAPAVASPEPEPQVDGYVLFAVGGTTFAVEVRDVREIVRAARLELLPEARASYGHGIALVDVRGRSIPVADLRADRAGTGDVLLPLWRHQVGLVVDRVVAVQSALELVPEHEDVPDALPSYARGVLRPAEGGAPVLLVAMPDAAELQADAARTDEPRLGADVLAAPVG